MAWLSDHEVVVGCANGAIAAWSLPQALDPALTFTPYLYVPVHQTFIAALATCYPSFPSHVVTASLDGYCRLTSLLDPFTDTVVNNRSRIAPTTIAWVDHVNAAVSCEEGAWVKFYPLRRFFSATTCCKHHGVVGCVGASLCHSFVLSGGSEGECSFSNPVRRTFHGKIVVPLYFLSAFILPSTKSHADGRRKTTSRPGSSSSTQRNQACSA